MKIEIPTRQEMYETFKLLENSHYKGVPGCMRIDSDTEGPVVGITACTHGNEPSGIAVMHYLLHNKPLDTILNHGSVIFTINNLEACKRYFEAEDNETKRQCRFVDLNFNRLPDDALTLKHDLRYEVQRLHELLPVLSEFDSAFEVHSTEQESQPMILLVGSYNTEYIKNFPIDIVLTDIDKIQIGKPISAFYGGENEISTIEIEAGSHENPQSFETAIVSALCFLENEGILKDIEIPHCPPELYDFYEVVDSVMFPDESYQLLKRFPWFEVIEKGEVLAQGESGEVIAPCSGHAIMAPKGTVPSNIEEEVMFITAPKVTKSHF